MNPLHGLFNPRSIAVVGASDRPDSIGARTLDNLLVHSRFDGEIWLVSTSKPELFGRKTWPSIESLPATPELAVVVVPAAAALGVLEQCAARGVRFAVVLSLQFLVASWLFRTWRGEAPERIRHLWGSLLRRLPAFVVCAAVLAWLDHSAAVATSVTLLRSAVTFGFTYALSYAVPAAAVYGSGLLRGFLHAFRVWRATFGADLLAWSGVWMVNGAMSLVAAVPDALDLYAPKSAGTRPSLVGRLANWLVVIPVSITALAIAASFATVIFFALEENRAPAGFAKGPVETVSGLQLDE